MLSSNLILKLILTPLIIVAATLVSRHWGERVGGLMIGLPLTSGPVSIFFAIEQGRAYAAGAAKGSILGLVPVAAFCAVYALSSRRFSWYKSSTFGIGAYFLAVWLASLAVPTLGIEVFLVPAVLWVALVILGKPDHVERTINPLWWDLPMRMIMATTLLVLITTLAGTLGPKWGGLLSPFPIFTFIMVTFAHSMGGPGAARQLMRGVLLGLFSYMAFFIIVTLLVQQVSLYAVYPLATLAALLVNGTFLIWLVGKGHSDTYTAYTNSIGTAEVKKR
jgi:hypothetical protein